MAVNQRLKCSAKCGALEFDAMVEKRVVSKGRRRSEKLVVIDKTFGDDGFPGNREVEAICNNCGAVLEIRMMAFAIGGRARAAVGVEDGGDGGTRRRIRVELGQVAQHVGERTIFHDCGDGGSGEAFKATVQGPLIAPQNGDGGPRLVEVGGVAARDDGSTFAFGTGCTHGTSDPGSKGAGNN